jgi:ribosomal RNA-processing protein 12
LDLVLNKIYDMTNEVTGNVAKSEATALPIARATLVALNVIAQKYLHLLNACLLSRFIGHASSAVADTRSPIRLLAIRLVRLLCIHLPAYALQQYKELLLNAVFCSQSSTDVTSRVRKANRLLFEILTEKLGRQSLESYASTQEGWMKQLKSVDRAIRRRQSRHSGQKSISEDNDDETVVSSVSAARTTRADSIFQLLEDSDNEETVSRNGNSARSQSVWIKEGENEDPMDLLDNRSIVNRITTVQPQPSRAGGTAADKKALEDRKEIGGFKLTKDGRLLIQDLDSLVPSKSRSKRTDMDVEMNDNVNSTNKKNNHSKGDEDSEDDEDMPTTSKYRPGGKGIHRNLASSTKSSKSDHKKKGDKFEPYAYIPLRQTKGQQKVLKKTIQKTLRNNATRPKNRKAK